LVKRVIVLGAVVLACAGCTAQAADDDSAMRWVEAACAGLTDTFGAVPSPQELNALGGGQRARAELLAGLDRAAAAADEARRRLDGYGAPAGTEAGLVHSGMLRLFDSVVAQVQQERSRLQQAAEGAEGPALGLLAVDALPAPIAEWGELMRTDELARLVEASPTCQRTRNELKDQI
jgi:hypothetical protein